MRTGQFIALMGMLGMIGGCVSHGLRHIEQAIAWQTSFYLCMEAAKLGTARAECDRLLKRQRK